MAATRASDADRDACVEDIESAFADGRITYSERESRTQSALQAKTLPELSALVADLRPGPAPKPKPPPAPKFQELPSLAPDPPAHAISPAVLMAILIVAVVGALAALSIWIFAGNGDHGNGPSTSFPSLPATSAPTSKPPVLKHKLALHTASGFKKFVALTRSEFGTTVVESAALYPDYASVNIATAANPRHTERWYFAKGYEGSPSKGTIGADIPLIDLSKVDVAAMVDAIQRAPSVLGVVNVDTTYLILQAWDGQPAMEIYVSNEFHETGYWVFSLAGKEIVRYAFE